jgi:hypothetical protein
MKAVLDGNASRSEMHVDNEGRDRCAHSRMRRKRRARPNNIEKWLLSQPSSSARTILTYLAGTLLERSYLFHRLTSNLRH